jgi:hypothetical protein
MAAMSLSPESRELPDGLPFHVGDIIGTGAFATYIPHPPTPDCNLTHLLIAVYE